MSEQTTEQRVMARQPVACPVCGTREIAPTFDGYRWDCRDGHEWEEGDEDA